MTYREEWLAHVDRWHAERAYLTKSGLDGVCECPAEVVGTCPTSVRYADRKLREALCGPVFRAVSNTKR